MAQLAERRQTARMRMELEITLSRAKGGPVSAKTIDIGPGGLRISSRRPLRVDECLEVSLPLADGGGGPVSATIRVMREEPLHVYGVRFEHLAASIAERLARLSA